MTETPPILVGVVSPRELIGHGIRSLLSSCPQRFEVVDLTMDATTLMAADVAIVDEAALGCCDARMASAWAGAAKSVVLLIVEDRVGGVPRAIEAGVVAAAVSLGTSATAFLSVIEAVAQGQDVNRLASDKWQDREAGLSERENEVLQLIADGMSNLEIAETLSLSINSVKSYWRWRTGPGVRPGRRGSLARWPGGSCRCQAGRAGPPSPGRRRSPGCPRWAMVSRLSPRAWS
jgi:DNA-binding NarL/FixJ family response regulator